MLNGMPDWKLVRSETCHPPRRVCSQSGLGEEGQIVDQAQFQHMAFVEVRARKAPLRVVGIDDFRDRAVGAIVDRMAVGVGQASVQVAEVPADSDLKGVVCPTGRYSSYG